MKDDVLDMLITARIEMSALVERPDAPDFAPACRNDNPADAECLEKAYNFLCAAILRLENET